MTVKEDRTFFPRLEPKPMATIWVGVGVENAIDPSKRIQASGMVDTGAFGLILPTAWMKDLGPLQRLAVVDLETADQRIVSAEVCGPVRISIAGFRPIIGEAVFVDMEPNPAGRYEPLVGYTVLETCGAVVDMVSHRLIARMYYDLKRAS